jgi:hypothetical protein
VETLHKVAKYNPLLSEEPLSSDDEAAADRSRVTGVVMGGTLERPQGTKAAKADAAAKRRSKKTDDDLEAETEAAAASRIADSFQSLTNSMVSGQEFDRMERAIKLLREQGRHALAERRRKTDELLSRLENEEDAEKTTTATEVSPVVAPPPPTRPLTPPPPLPPSPPSSVDERGAGCYSPTTDCGVDDIADGISALQEDFTPSSRVATTTLPPPTRLPSSLVVFTPPTPAVATLTPTVTVTTESYVLVTAKDWQLARRERIRLALAAMLEAEATHGPSPTPNEEDDGESTFVGVVGRGKVSPVPEESSQLKWGTIDTNPIAWGTSTE